MDIFIVITIVTMRTITSSSSWVDDVQILLRCEVLMIKFVIPCINANASQHGLLGRHHFLSVHLRILAQIVFLLQQIVDLTFSFSISVLIFYYLYN